MTLFSVPPGQGNRKGGRLHDEHERMRIVKPIDPVELTREFVAVKSVSRWSNATISDLVEARMQACGFEMERLEYTDEHGERKISLVGKIGEGEGGLAFMSHTDTVPGQEADWPPYDPRVKDGRIYGRGSCDMKGPLAATIVAAASVDPARLKKPILVTATADEEVGGGGARQVAEESRLFNETLPTLGVVAEPTRMTPVYAHKGSAHVLVTAYGKAAHTSLDVGVSANFLIAPFLADMAELARAVKTDERFINREFNPPTNGFNMVIDDGGTKQNVTAAKTTCHICFRTMPGDRSEELVEMIAEKARGYGLEVTSTAINPPFYVAPESAVVRLASEVTGGREPETVPYGTDALQFWDKPIELVIMGPGDIAQAHTVGEYLELDQLQEAVDVYKRMIERVCM